MDKKLLSFKETQQILGMGKNKLLNLIQTNNSDFPAFKIGGKWYIDKNKLDLWIEAQTKEVHVCKSLETS